MRVTVLTGGTSSERDVALASGLRIAEALRTRGHRVTTVDTARGTLSLADEQVMLARGVVQREPPSEEELRQMARDTLPQMLRTLPELRDTDVIFLGLHGGYGEDGTVQAILDLTGVPYTGSGHLASALAMDKDLSKRLFRDAGVPTADWAMLRQDVSGEREGADPDRILALGMPLVVKPSKQGSTVGLSVVRNAGDIGPAVDLAFRYDDEVMLEAFVPGRELTVAILGDEALPVGEIFPKHDIYDYECKYTPGMAVEEFPAKITAEEAARVQEFARRAFRALKLRGYARIDFRMTPPPEGEFYCLEANTLPGMTATSLIPQSAAAAGITFPELCERIAELALAGAGEPAREREGEER